MLEASKKGGLCGLLSCLGGAIIHRAVIRAAQFDAEKIAAGFAGCD